MRIAVISDVHGNLVGLDTVLADLQTHPADQIVCLGDMIQGGPQPAEVIARLRALACPVVMGNADAWLLTGRATGAEPTTERQLAVREWQLARLTAEDRGYIERFEPTVEIGLGDGRTLLCFQGSPASFDDIILPTTPEEEFQRLLGPYAPALMCGGHTHLQQICRLGDALFFNPGSAGFAYSHQQPESNFKADPWAEYALLTYEDGRVGLEFRRVPYQAESLVAIYLASGRPYAEEAAQQYRPAVS
ncbi:MAG TPA: metallophosphoesterase family protein [Roseiflexaceae bacterium]|nr:metallophosphoesterase family protein [Roseiflexaceae bacterium]